MHLTDNKLTTVVSEKMKGFPEDTIKEVLDFIEFLRYKKEHGKRGAPETILRHLGAWKFEKGELDNILEDIKKSRELEG
ncbi:MAG TPA: hypothetical protein DEP85_05630 [Holosporales bacterium]|nr:hypothetical protein [Holosporales bacterium]